MKEGMHLWLGGGLLLLLVVGGSALCLNSTGDPDGDDEAVATEHRSPRGRRRGDSPRSTKNGTPRPAPIFDRSASVDDRVEALEREVEQLHAELAAMRLRTRIDGSRAGGRRMDDSDPSEVRAQVAELLDEERESEREERATRIQERMQTQVEDSVQDLAEAVELSAQQRDAVSGAWSSEAEQVGAMIAKARSEGSGFREVREKVRELRSQTDEAMEEELDGDQMEAYRDVRRQMGPRGGRGGPGRGAG